MIYGRQQADLCLQGTLAIKRFAFSALLTKLPGFAKILFPSLGSDRTSKIQQAVLAAFGVSLYNSSVQAAYIELGGDKQFLAPPTNFVMQIVLITMHFRLISEPLQETASQVVLK